MKFPHLPHLLFSGFIFFLSSCPDTVDPVYDPPEPVRILPYGGDSLPVETGLRSSAGNEGIIIEWIKPGNPETPVREYRIFRSLGTDSPFAQIASVFDNEEAQYQDNLVSFDTAYFYYVQAVDTRGKAGTFHPDSIRKYAASIMLKRAANPQRPFYNDTVTTKPYLAWCYPVIDLPSQYVVKIANTSQNVIWIAKIPNRIYNPGCDEFGDKEYLMFNSGSYSAPNDSISASASVTVTYSNPVWLQGPRLPKGSYYWRIESRWANTSYHSRSNWGSFTITKDFQYP